MGEWDRRVGWEGGDGRVGMGEWDERVGMGGVRASMEVMEHLYVFTYMCGIALVCICIYCMGLLCTEWGPCTAWPPVYYMGPLCTCMRAL